MIQHLEVVDLLYEDYFKLMSTTVPATYYTCFSPKNLVKIGSVVSV